MDYQRISTTQTKARKMRGGGSSTAEPQPIEPNTKELNTIIKVTSASELHVDNELPFYCI